MGHCLARSISKSLLSALANYDRYAACGIVPAWLPVSVLTIATFDNGAVNLPVLCPRSSLCDFPRGASSRLDRPRAESAPGCRNITRHVSVAPMMDGVNTWQFAPKGQRLMDVWRGRVAWLVEALPEHVQKRPDHKIHICQSVECRNPRLGQEQVLSIGCQGNVLGISLAQAEPHIRYPVSGR
jgi:hypothetical protein